MSRLILRGAVYYVRMQVRGRRLWRSTHCTTLAKARVEADRIRAELRIQRRPQPRAMPTFGEWATVYQTVYSGQKRAPWRDAQILAPVITRWRSLPLDAITRSTVVSYLTQRRRQVAAATLDRERGTLQAIFQRAIEEGLLERNPFQGIKREGAEPRVRILTPPHEQRLRAVLSPQANRWLTVLLGTGLRLGELRGLEEHDLDFSKHAITVRAETAKLGKARVVPMFLSVQLALEEQLRSVGVLWPANPQNYRDLLATGCQKAGIPHCSPHDLRHTFATRYLQQPGRSIYTLAKILGHSSVKMTERHYAHLLGEDVVALAFAEATGAATGEAAHTKT